MSAVLSPANKTTIVILLLAALLSMGVMSSMTGPIHIVVTTEQTGAVLMEVNWLQVTLGSLAVVGSACAIVVLSVAAPPVAIAVAASYVGAWAAGVGGALTIWDGAGQPGWDDVF